jgi:hypothetical protein
VARHSLAIEGVEMEDGNRHPEDSVQPPRWAEALLGALLGPGVAETESGDLLEAYRDSIHPVRGTRSADLWYIRQVAGYVARAAFLSQRNWVLVGLCLCFLTAAVSFLRYSSLVTSHDARNLAGIGVGFLFYAGVALWRTRPVTFEDTTVVRLGTRWGIAIGVLWTIGYVAGNLVTPHRLGAQSAILLALVAFVLPFAVGVHGAASTGRVRAGMRAGFWSGFIGGMMAFLALAVVGYICAFFPGFPGAEIPPPGHVYTAEEFQRINVMDAMGGELAHLFLIGGLFGTIEGVLGGCFGIWWVRATHEKEQS